MAVFATEADAKTAIRNGTAQDGDTITATGRKINRLANGGYVITKRKTEDFATKDEVGATIKSIGNPAANELNTADGKTHFDLTGASAFTVTGPEEIVQVRNATNETITVEGQDIPAKTVRKIIKSGSSWRIWAALLMVLLTLGAPAETTPQIFTTAERDALTLSATDDKRIIYNSTTSQWEGWNGTAWASLGEAPPEVPTALDFDFTGPTFPNVTVAGSTYLHTGGTITLTGLRSGSDTVNNGDTLQAFGVGSPIAVGDLANLGQKAVVEAIRYVDPDNGSDTADGKLSGTAWKTLAPLASEKQTSVEVEIAAGATEIPGVTILNKTVFFNCLAGSPRIGRLIPTNSEVYLTGTPIIEAATLRQGGKIYIRNNTIVRGNGIANFYDGFRIESGGVYVDANLTFETGHRYAVTAFVGTEFICRPNIQVTGAGYTCTGLLTAGDLARVVLPRTKFIDGATFVTAFGITNASVKRPTVALTVEDEYAEATGAAITLTGDALLEGWANHPYLQARDVVTDELAPYTTDADPITRLTVTLQRSGNGFMQYDNFAVNVAGPATVPAGDMTVENLSDAGFATEVNALVGGGTFFTSAGLAPVGTNLTFDVVFATPLADIVSVAITGRGDVGTSSFGVVAQTATNPTQTTVLVAGALGSVVHPLNPVQADTDWHLGYETTPTNGVVAYDNTGTKMFDSRDSGPPTTITDIDFGGTDPTNLTDRTTIKDFVDSKINGSWLADAASIAARDAVATFAPNQKILVLDDGDGNPAAYMARGDSAQTQPANWFKFWDGDNLTGPLKDLVAADLQRNTGNDDYGRINRAAFRQGVRDMQSLESYESNGGAFDFPALIDDQAIFPGQIVELYNAHATDPTAVSYKGQLSSLRVVGSAPTADTTPDSTFNLPALSLAHIQYDGTNTQVTINPAILSAEGLRGPPVADQAALVALPAREFEMRQRKDTGGIYVFKLTADLTTVEDANASNLADAGTTGKWVLQPTETTLSDVVVKVDEWTGSIGISNGAQTTVDTKMDWSSAEYFEVTVKDTVSSQTHKTYRGDVSVITSTTGQSLLMDRFGGQYIWVNNLNLATGVFRGQIQGGGAGWVVTKVTLWGTKQLSKVGSLPLYNAANLGAIVPGGTVVADLGVVLQDGDEIKLQLDIGAAHCVWNGGSAVATVHDGTNPNTFTFSQTGTVLNLTAANSSGTRRWLKIVK